MYKLCSSAFSYLGDFHIRVIKNLECPKTPNIKKTMKDNKGITRKIPSTIVWGRHEICQQNLSAGRDKSQLWYGVVDERFGGSNIDFELHSVSFQ